MKSYAINIDMLLFIFYDILQLALRYLDNSSPNFLFTSMALMQEPIFVSFPLIIKYARTTKFLFSGFFESSVVYVPFGRKVIRVY